MKLGDQSALPKLYIRWIVILILLGGVGLLAIDRYCKEVASFSPEELLIQRPEGVVRLLGRVEPGTLLADGSFFKLSDVSGGKTLISIQYAGTPYENLRELKVLMIKGKWDTGRMAFIAESFSVTPNYHFVVAAYLIALIPLGLFLLNMEREVLLLSLLIKGEKGYEPIAHSVLNDE